MLLRPPFSVERILAVRFTPVLALLTSFLIPLTAVAGWFGKDGPALSVERKVSHYRDWNTGMRREEVTIVLRVKGRELSNEKLGLALGANEEDAQLTTVFEAVSAGPNDALVLYRTSGNFELAHLYMDNDQLRGQSLVRDLTQNWFTDARMPGWISVQQENRLHLVQINPLRVVDIGPGVLLDVRGDIALMAEEGYNKPASSIHAVSISQGKSVAELPLEKACFALPQFEFTHPLVYARFPESTLEQLMFQHGPAWFDTNFELAAGTPPTLRLKATQKLPRPALERWYVDLRGLDADNRDTLDLQPPACPNNANPRLGADKEPYPTKSVMAEDFCLNADYPGVSAATRQQRCILPATTGVVVKAPQWQIEALRFAYRPQNGKAPIEQVVYQLRQGQTVNRAIAGDGGEDLRLREVLPIGEGQALIKARGDGAYELFHAYSDGAGKLRLKHLETLAYSSSPLDTSKPGWVYQRSRGVLIKIQPFGFERVGSGLLDIRGEELLFQYVNYGSKGLMLASLPFQPEPQAPAQDDDAPVYQLRANCRLADDPDWELAVPSADATLTESAAWFSRNFDYTNGKPGSIVLRKDHQLRVKPGCGPDSQ
jgi:hypothetical protein